MPRGTPRTAAQRRARHKKLHGSKSKPPAKRRGRNRR